MAKRDDMPIFSFTFEVKSPVFFAFCTQSRLLLRGAPVQGIEMNLSRKPWINIPFLCIFLLPTAKFFLEYAIKTTKIMYASGLIIISFISVPSITATYLKNLRIGMVVIHCVSEKQCC
jgi:hypothetical protein